MKKFCFVRGKLFISEERPRVNNKHRFTPMNLKGKLTIPTKLVIPKKSNVCSIHKSG